jgi:hypothetical protein
VGHLHRGVALPALPVEDCAEREVDHAGETGILQTLFTDVANARRRARDLVKVDRAEPRPMRLCGPSIRRLLNFPSRPKIAMAQDQKTALRSNIWAGNLTGLAKAERRRFLLEKKNVADSRDLLADPETGLCGSETV